MPDLRIDSDIMKSAAGILGCQSGEMRETARLLISLYSCLEPGFESEGQDTLQRLIQATADILDTAAGFEELSETLSLAANLYSQAEDQILQASRKARRPYARPQPHGGSRAGSAPSGKIPESSPGQYDTDEHGKGDPGQYDTDERDTDRTQELLMDQYLSNACLDLLEQDKYSKEVWEKASAEERKWILTDFIRDINRIMGTDMNKSIVFSELDENIRGFYDSAANSVTVNSLFLDPDASNSYTIMKTLIHEMRHCYQHTACSQPDRFLVSEETLARWKNSFEDYKKIDIVGYDAYVKQPVEWDAKLFAGQKSDISALS